MAVKFVKSSSLIIARKLPLLSGVANKSFDYDILCLTKNPKGNSYAGELVFPGGALSTADCDSDGWQTVFQQSGHYNARVCKDFSSNKFTADDSRKICAIRETFEETGVLLCKPINHFEIKMKESHGAAIYDLGSNASYWQSAVQKDASKFIDLCLHFKVIPELSVLFKWNCWKTPAIWNKIPARKRFESVFYFVRCNVNPEIKIDNGEICQYKWYKPSESLDDLKLKKLSMLPPQQYNLTLLSQFPDLSHLTAFAKHHEMCHTCSTPYLPQFVQCSDGFIVALPGDELYVSGLDESCAPCPTELKIDETRKDPNKLNRFENINGVLNLRCNFKIHKFLEHSY